MVNRPDVSELLSRAMSSTSTINLYGQSTPPEGRSSTASRAWLDLTRWCATTSTGTTDSRNHGGHQCWFVIWRIFHNESGIGYRTTTNGFGWHTRSATRCRFAHPSRHSPGHHHWQGRSCVSSPYRSQDGCPCGVEGEAWRRAYHTVPPVSAGTAANTRTR